MNRRTVLSAAVLVAVSLVSAAMAQSVVDDQGHSLVLAGAPRRIVSLAPNVTEILFALGLSDEVAGVTRYCDYPSAALLKPKVGGLIDPSPETIQSLSPDLVIAFRGNPLRTIERLKSIGLPVFVLDIGKEIDSVFPLLEKIGRITRREADAGRIAAGLKSRLDAVRDRLQDVKEEPRVFLALRGNGLWTCGRESYINDLIARCKARNVAGAIHRDWLHYSLEQIVRDDPEIIIILARSVPDFERSRDRFVADRRLRGVAAIRTRRVYFLDENITSRFGPRLVTALEETARRIHPEKFGSSSPS